MNEQIPTETGAASAEHGAELPPAVLAATEQKLESSIREPLAVTLTPANVPPTDDQVLWAVIHQATDAVSYGSYERFIECVFSHRNRDSDGIEPPPSELLREDARSELEKLAGHRHGVFRGADEYALLKAATEVFLMTYCGVKLDEWNFCQLSPAELEEQHRRLGAHVGRNELNDIWQRYLVCVNGNKTLPYLALISAKLGGAGLLHQSERCASECYGVLMEKLSRPLFLELINCYFMEESLLVQTFNAIALRFQNKLTGEGRDPLANLEIDPLRRLNSLLWGFIQDSPHHLSVARRAAEYEHQYGVSLCGKAVRDLRPSDRRRRFLACFHRLIELCDAYYKQADNTTVVADGFPVLNALKEVHLELSGGAHNQFGDLPWQSRQEMLMRKWILSRPQLREFLPARTMVGLPERWMQRVESMKVLQGWSRANVTMFHDLAECGERLLLSIRFGAWSTTREPARAANWANYWRTEVKSYTHAYRAVTGVDLVSGGDQRFLPPNFQLNDPREARSHAAAIAGGE